MPSLIPEYPSLIPVERDASKDLVDDFIDVAQHRIVDVVGDDTYGRKVIGMLLFIYLALLFVNVLVFPQLSLLAGYQVTKYWIIIDC